MFGQIQHKRIYENIADAIIELVGSGVLRAGEKLPSERRLADELCVSRNSLREALRYLERAGYIRSCEAGGYQVGDITPGNFPSVFSSTVSQDKRFAIDIIGVRQQLEIHMAGLAAQNATQEQLARIYETICEMRKNIEDGGVGIKEDNLFHLEIARASSNQAFAAVAEHCFELMSLSRRATLVIPGQPERSLADHIDIFEAIRRGDARKAEEEMRIHLSKARMNVSNMMEE